MRGVSDQELRDAIAIRDNFIRVAPLRFTPQSEQHCTRSWRYSYLKRSFDIAAALFLVLLFLVPGLLIALIIKTTSSGPLFYRERRVGRDGVFFRIFKFRTMVANASEFGTSVNEGHAGAHTHFRMHKQKGDPRVTAVGRSLRAWSLDELPQLFNVIRGDMSLVGPRPVIAEELEQFGDLAEEYQKVKPGITGVWQVSGRSRIGYRERALLDALYATTWSMKYDMMILLRTLPAVLSRDGAH